MVWVSFKYQAPRRGDGVEQICTQKAIISMFVFLLFYALFFFVFVFCFSLLFHTSQMGKTNNINVEKFHSYFITQTFIFVMSLLFVNRLSAFARRHGWNRHLAPHRLSTLTRCVRCPEPLIFRLSIIVVCSSAIVLARKWPALMLDWHEVECDLPEYLTQMEKGRLAYKLKMVTVVAMALSLGELDLLLI